MISSIELLAGASLNQMLETESTYPVPVAGDATVPITVAAPALKAEGLHLQTWGSSWLLARKLHTLQLPGLSGSSSGPDRQPPFPILELGAGTGLAGLAAAAVLSAPVLLTDLAPIVPGLAANAALNAGVLAARSSARPPAAAGALDWKDPARIDLAAGGGSQAGQVRELYPTPESKPRLILTTDTMYTEAHPALVCGTLTAWLARTADARAVVVYPMRMAYLDAMREFWERMEGAGLEAVEQGQELLEEDGRGWDDERLHEWSVWRWTVA
jgi:hypothetical protein